MKKLFCIAALVCTAAGFSARGQDIRNPSNTVVRFTVSTGGAVFGNFDIELFDEDKPETVRNFLIYVYSGMYSNLVLNRLDPDFVVQSGRLSVPNPGSTNIFSSFVTTESFGPITNEYSVGPQLSNDFGTIAMARTAGDTNSAGAEWFFNLTNNAFLNDVDGGFTVFGHIVNTTNARSGTNLLNYFNTLTSRRAITENPYEQFTELPASTNRFDIVTNRVVVTNFTYITNMMTVMTNPTLATNITVQTNTLPVQVRDLFTITPSFLHGGQARDTNAPSIAISDTNTVIRTTNSTITLSGLAGDNLGVARVQYDAGLGIVIASGKTNWTVTDLPLSPGTNVFFVRALDYFGNFSPVVKRTIFYSVPRRVTLELTGNGVGKVTGITNGQVLELGVNYNLIAKPKAGHYFNGWRGGVNSASRAIYFTMSERSTNIIARFTTTLLGLARGTYQGVFFPAASSPPRSAGFISLNLSGNGSYTGRLSPIGASYPIHGVFDPNGVSVITGTQITNLLTLFMGLQTEGAEGIGGTYTDGTHGSSAVQLWRVQTSADTNPIPAGRYTFNITPPAVTNAVTDGSGFGTVTVDALGRVALSGELGDGEVFTEKTTRKFKPAILKGNRFAFYAPAYKGRGGVLGLATLASNHTFTASGKWFGPDFPGKSGQAVRLAGSSYTPPPARLFEWTNGIVTLSGDGLASPLKSEVVLETNGTFTVLANTNNLQLTVAPATGLITGHFTPPASNVATVLRGAVLQGSNSAAGYFPGAVRNGGFELRPAP